MKSEEGHFTAWALTKTALRIIEGILKLHRQLRQFF